MTGAANVAPRIPNSSVPAVVTSMTTSGCSRRALPKASGSSRFCRVLLVSRVMARIRLLGLELIEFRRVPRSR